MLGIVEPGLVCHRAAIRLPALYHELRDKGGRKGLSRHEAVFILYPPYVLFVKSNFLGTLPKNSGEAQCERSLRRPWLPSPPISGIKTRRDSISER